MTGAWPASGLMLLLALAAPGWWRESNSHASSRRAERAYQAKQYPGAAAAFGKAHQFAPSARSAFNLGTAQIAAGEAAPGSAALAGALKDPSLRADAFYNRGNSALGAGALDHAIRDYSDALRTNPAHLAAKRNLEIALSRRQQQQKSPRGGDRGNKAESKQPSPSPDQGRPKEGDLDMEALLRSVQQQEQEEMRRMKARTGQPRVGW